MTLHRRQAPRFRPGRFMPRMPTMNPQPVNRPRMSAIYAPGTVRARRWHGEGDMRGYRPPRGWTARADLTDLHTPSRAEPCRVPCGGLSKRKNNPHRPQVVSPWGRWSSIRARRWPRPVPTSKAKSPRRRLWPGGDGASAQWSCAQYGNQRPVRGIVNRIRPQLAPRQNCPRTDENG